MAMLTYETVVAATEGCLLETTEVLDFFNGFIDRLCTQPFVDACGHVERGVDMYMKSYLQGKLLRAILRFKV